MTCEAMRGLGNEKVNSSLLWSLNKGPRKVSGPQNREIVAPLVLYFSCGVKLLTSAPGELGDGWLSLWAAGRVVGVPICFNNQL